MKVGYRKRSFSKSLSASTFGKWNRGWKRAIIPGYGRRGINKITHPSKYLYNKAYHKFTAGIPGTGLKNAGSTSRKTNASGRQGHSLVLHIFLISIGVGLFTIPYYSISKNHYWHI